MKYLLFIILLVSLVITAGCVSQNNSATVPPAPSINHKTVQTMSGEPIVGVWEETSHDITVSQTFTKDHHYIFNSSSLSYKPNIETGTWVKIRENEYSVTVGNDSLSIMYHPDNDFLTIPGITKVPIYRAGKAS